ncbi:MAG: tetratricopeptide repeat protein [Acidobacteriota bacterium]
MADRARVHLRYCERMRRQERPPKTAEDYYARGVAALNSRDLGLAIQYLSKSDKIKPSQEYVHYSLAAAYGLQGDPDNALSHLETAIKLRPQNRLQARLDEDFQTLAADPRFIRLLGPDGRRALT